MNLRFLTPYISTTCLSFRRKKQSWIVANKLCRSSLILSRSAFIYSAKWSMSWVPKCSKGTPLNVMFVSSIIISFRYRKQKERTAGELDSIPIKLSRLRGFRSSWSQLHLFLLLFSGICALSTPKQVLNK